MSGDGRLDLDELGDVIDHASTLDTPARTEVLDDGRGRSWGERLEDAGVTPWMRRHRVALASVTAVAVLVPAGIVGYRTLVPPPVDPEIRVAVTPVIPSQYVLGETVQTYDQVGIFVTPQSLRSAYALSAPDEADRSANTYSIVGLTGPGVRASTASLLPSPTGGVADQVARQDVDVIADCFDPAVLRSQPSDYALTVARTDDRGRTVTGAVPMPAGAPDWSAFLTSTCLQAQSQFGIVAQSVSVAIDRRSNVVQAAVVVSNALDVPSTVGLTPMYGVTKLVPTMAPIALAAKRGAVLPIAFEVRDCAFPELSWISTPTFPGSQSYDVGGAPGVYLSVTFPPEVIDAATDPTGLGGTGQTPLVLTPAQRGTIEDGVATVCAGAPSASAEVREVGSARKVTGVFPSGNAESTRFPITLVVTADGAGRVRITPPEALADESVTTRVAPAAATAVDGRATLRTWVDVDCQTGYAPPPVAQVEVTTPRGAFPLQVPVDDANLARAVAASCPELPLEQLLSFGWAPPA